MDGRSSDITAENIARLKTLFPEVCSEDKIDFVRLRQILGEDTFVSGEHYELSWAGKSEARKEVQKQTTATLIPDRASSIDFDNAQHVFIEGENLEVLRVLQKSYFGKVKMIYIDPPYNTGNDSFVYPDDYAERQDNYKKRTGIADENGFLNKQDLWRKNTKENGQFHSVWLSMMFPRLYLARNLLRDDGVIFISIDDNEAANLKLLCDDVFGEENFVDCIIWKKRYGGGAKEKHLVSLHEYVLFYSKDITNLDEIFIPLNPESIDRYYRLKDDKYEKRGPYRTHPLEAGKAMDERLNLIFPIPAPDGTIINPKKQWLWSKERTMNALLNNELEFTKGKDGWSVGTKQYLKDEDGNIREGKVFSIIDDVYTQHGTNEIISIFGDAKIFNYPKPTFFAKKLLEIGTTSSDIILDFFAGSGTTAQAVMELNEDDGGNRQCILVQMPEMLEENSEAYKAGYRTIADITKARITKVIEKLQKARDEEAAEQQAEMFADAAPVMQALSFAAYSLAESNFKIWRGDVAGKEAIEQQLLDFMQPEKHGSDHDNMLTELLLKSGLGLNLDYIQENNFYKTAAGIWFCFAAFTPAMKEEIARSKPKKAVFLNSCFATDMELSNLHLELRGHGVELTVI